MQTTGNLNLKKPEGTDIVDINDLNGNMDILDAEVSRVASTTANGRMSAADKTKLNGIATGANNYVHPSTHPASIIAQDSSNRFVTDAEKSAWNAKAGTSVATTSANGLMSSTDKSKLDGVAAGANNYVHPSSHPASIITQDANNRFVTDTEKAAWNAKASTSVATTSTNGLMSSTDKSKLDGVAAGAQVNTVTSVAGRTGAVALTKSDVGLASVQNYGIATQAQAEAGTDATVYMTPQRTKQYVDTRLLNNVQMRVNNGRLEFNLGMGWQSVGAQDYNPYTKTVTVSTATAESWITAFDITGEGEICQVNSYITGAINVTDNPHHVRITVDGVAQSLTTITTDTMTTGFFMPDQLVHTRTGTNTHILQLKGTNLSLNANQLEWGVVGDPSRSHFGYVLSTHPIRFKSSFKVEIFRRNVSGTFSVNISTTIKGGMR